MTSQETFKPEEIREQVEKILTSPMFRTSKRLKRFLRFIVEETLAGRTNEIKGYSIALEVFDKDDEFDPQADPIVRVEAGRLRRYLERYYESEGKDDALCIQVPKGGYIPRFCQCGTRLTTEESEKRPTLQTAHPQDFFVQSDFPSIAVLPLSNLSKNSDREYLATGLAEELSTSLSRFTNLRVISCYSCRHFKERLMELPQISRELGADYLVTGSIRERGAAIRISIQLNKTSTGKQIWADNFDGTLTTNSLFTLEDEIVKKVSGVIAGEYGIISQEMARGISRKRTDDLSVYEATLMCSHHNQILTLESYVTTLQALEQAVKISPEYGPAWAMLGIMYADAHVFKMADMPEALERAARSIHKAARLDPDCQVAQYGMMYISLLRRDQKSILAAVEKSLVLNPYDAFQVGVAGFFMALAGEFNAGLTILKESFLLNPYYPGWFHLPFFLDAYEQKQYEQALDEAHKFAMPDFFWDPLLRASALGQLGRKIKARKAYEQIINLQADFEQHARQEIEVFILSDETVEHILEGLYKAGLSRKTMLTM